MIMRRPLLVTGVLLVVGGCASPDRGIFVTSTNIGINADATSRVVNIGYDRTEGFVGPAYVEDGTLPSVVGYLHSNLSVLDPQIRQLYATGQAASIVASEKPRGPVSEPTGQGKRRVT